MKIEQTKKEIQNINLTQEEKDAMLNRILSSPLPSPYTSIPSWWKTKLPRPIQYVALSLLILVATGGSISYAALNTIPGDTLYPVKIGITEPILDIITFHPESKAKWEAEKALRRLDEASKLAERNGLTIERKDEIEKRLDKNVEKFNKMVEKTEKKESREKSQNLIIDFDNSLTEREEESKKTRKDKNEENEQEKEVKILENKVRAKVFFDRGSGKRDEDRDKKDENKQINLENLNWD